MRKLMWAIVVVLPLVVAGGLVFARPQNPASERFFCPLTGEELPCSKCCPLNQGE